MSIRAGECDATAGRVPGGSEGDVSVFLGTGGGAVRRELLQMGEREEKHERLTNLCIYKT